MADFRIAKVVSALPGTLVADTLYIVRVGDGVDLHVTDSTAQAKPLNAATTVISARYTRIHTPAGAYTTTDVDLDGYVRAPAAVTLHVPPSDAVGARIDFRNTSGSAWSLVGVANATLAGPVSFGPDEAGSAVLVASDGTDAEWDVFGGSV